MGVRTDLCFQPFEDRVSTPPDADVLGRGRHVVGILRLVVNPDGVLSHGEVVDASGRVRGRFGEWESLVPILRSWLENEGEE
jgi:hypothetical protein